MSDADDRINAFNSVMRLADLLYKQRRIINEMEATLEASIPEDEIAVMDPERCRHCQGYLCRCSAHQQDDWKAELDLARRKAQAF